MSALLYVSQLLAPFLEALGALMLVAAFRLAWAEFRDPRIGVAAVGAIFSLIGALLLLPSLGGSPTDVGANEFAGLLMIARIWLHPVGTVLMAIGLFSFMARRRSA
jgi:hypothetical protein